MPFNTIQDIQREFRLTISSPDELRKKLQELRASLHPDRHGGSFRSEEDKEQFLKIGEALDFLDRYTGDNEGQHLALMPVETINALVEVIRDIVPSAHSVISPESVTGRHLEELINQHNKEIKTRSLYPKLTASAVATAFTVAWAFPSIISEHPILRQYVEVSSLQFVSMWGASVVLMALTWYAAKVVEARHKEFANRLQTEFFQDQLFGEFLLARVTNEMCGKLQGLHRMLRRLSWELEDRELGNLSWELEELEELLERLCRLGQKRTHRGRLDHPWRELENLRLFIKRLERVVSHPSLAPSIRKSIENIDNLLSISIMFSKSDFVTFILDTEIFLLLGMSDRESNSLGREKTGSKIAQIWHRVAHFIYRSVSWCSDVVTSIRKRVIDLLFGNPYEVDMRTAQALADHIFERAKKKNLIDIVDDRQSLADYYVWRLE